MRLEVTEMSLTAQIIFFIVLATLMLTQGTIIFLSARKRGKNAWFWGFIGLLNIPSSFLLYYFFVIYPERKKGGS
ncbi:transcriptional regulator [Bacillus massiliigorillae]|uniref:transcriptional regulator n=1 Tax=Bacillus massiliigorillae TaxID=1243664 RepID=UPI0003A1C450|nr:transcriptional regulator [Bacillus massiliigorillae]